MFWGGRGAEIGDPNCGKTTLGIENWQIGGARIAVGAKFARQGAVLEPIFSGPDCRKGPESDISGDFGLSLLAGIWSKWHKCWRSDISDPVIRGGPNLSDGPMHSMRGEFITGSALIPWGAD